MVGLLMEMGAEFDRERLHRKQYFAELMGTWGSARIGEGYAAA